MIKRIMSILISVLLISSFAIGGVSANSVYDELAAVNMLPSGFAENNGSTLITRAEFAYIAANLMQSGEMEAKSTKFVDVSSDNQYSGYIDFLTEIGIVSGVASNSFAPDGYVTAQMAYKVMTNVLGYTQIAEKLGGYPKGYEKVADRLGFNLNASFDGQYLTRDGALSLGHYVLTNCFDKLISYTLNGEIKTIIDAESNFAVLGDRHKISVYTGVVESVPNSNYVNIKIEKNKYDTNHIILENGSIERFESNGKNVRDYEGANVTVWVNSDNQVVYIALKKAADIKYGYVYSVNGVTNVSGMPSIASLNQLSLINDDTEYDISSDVKVRYNGNIVTNSVQLEGNFVRLVFQNDEIIFIETWDMTEAGLITSVSPEYIEYTKGSVSGVRLKDLSSYKNKRYYIDNQPAGEGHVKSDIVFDYYASGDDLVVVASEKKIIDRFCSYNGTGLEIGDSIYKYKNLYYSLGQGYKADNDFNKLMGTDISAYAAPDGYIRYIKVNDASQINNNSFYGVVCGVDTDIFNEEAELSVWVYGDQVTKKTLKINNKTKFLNNITISELKANSKDVNGYGLYEFTLNSKGIISEIKKPTPFYGYGADINDKDARVSVSVSTVDSNTNTYVTVNGKKLYFKNAPMMVLFEKDGQFIAEKTDPSVVLGKSGMSVTLTFFGDEEKSPLPTMVLLTGDVVSLGGVYSQYGILTEKRLSISEDGEECVDLYVTKGDSTPIIYTVTKEYASTLPDYALLEYKEDTNFSVNDINISKIVDLDGDPSNWLVSTIENEVGLHEGRFEKIEGKRLYLEETAYFLNPGTSGKPIVKYTQNAGNRTIQVIDAAEIACGDYIYYYLASGGEVRAIIVAD